MIGSRYFWISLSLCFIMTAMTSETIIAVHTDHDCTGESCPVCVMVQRTENFSSQFRYAAVHSGFSATSILPALVVLSLAVFYRVPPSSVRLKVKMNM